jgi:hypothetical protein
MRHIYDVTGNNAHSMVYLLDFNGVKVLHCGVNVEYDRARFNTLHLDQESIDILFLVYVDTSTATQQFVRDVIRPKIIIPMHFTKFPKTTQKDSQRFRETYSRAVVFRESMESRVYDQKDHYPDPNGTITNITSDQRFNSIQCAINYANPGEVILIEPGIYTESIILNKDITLQSADPNDPFYIGGTIIQGDAYDPVLTLSGNTEACVIAGLTLRAGLVGVTGASTDTMLRNCRIMDNLTHGVELFQESNPHLDHCLITANGQTGITMRAAAGPTGRGIKHCKPVIENCIIVDNNDANIVGGQPVIVDSFID